MDRTIGTRGPGTDAEGILRELTVRQHLTPHGALGEVVGDIVARVGVCQEVATRAMARLDLDPSRAVGRLKRGELIQLARGMYRMWSVSLASNAPTANSST